MIPDKQLETAIQYLLCRQQPYIAKYLHDVSSNSVRGEQAVDRQIHELKWGRTDDHVPGLQPYCQHGNSEDNTHDQVAHASFASDQNYAIDQYKNVAATGVR